MKILHSADLHLMADLSSPEGKHRFEVFEGLCGKAKDADVLVFAGDLFDSWPDSKDSGLLAKVKAALTALAPISVIIIPGNHEFLHSDGRNPFDPKPDLGQDKNVRLITETPFGSALIGKVEFLAFPFQEGLTTSDLFQNVPPCGEGTWRVAVLHGTAVDRPNLRMSAYGQDEVEPGGDLLIRDQDLKTAGFRYAALGHIHKKDEWTFSGGAFASYPGSPCAVRRTEDTPRGYNLVDLDERSGRVRVSRQELETAARAERRAFVVAPGREQAALDSIRDWLQSLDKSLWPVAKVSGLGNPGPLREGKRRLDSQFGSTFKLPPEIVLETADFDPGDKAAGSQMVRDFMAAIQKRSEEAGPDEKPKLARAMLLGWFALSLNESKAVDAFRKTLEERP